MKLVSDDPKRAADIYIAAEHSKLAPELLIAAVVDKTSLRYTLAPEQFPGFLARTGGLKSPPLQWKDLFSGGSCRQRKLSGREGVQALTYSQLNQPSALFTNARMYSITPAAAAAWGALFA